MRPKASDRLIVWIGTPLVVIALAWAAADAGGPSGFGEGFAPPAGPVDLTGTGQAATARAQLPEGVSIDPNTLELVGLVIEPVDGSTVIAWDTLRRYQYQEGLEGLPDDVRALEGKKVTIAGFLLPLYEFDDIHEFHLVASHWSCCFGVPPGLSGWIAIDLAPGEKGLQNTIEPLKVTGTFKVGEKKEAGYVVAIYAIEDAKATLLGW